MFLIVLHSFYATAFISLILAKAYQAMHLPWGIPEGGAGVEGCLMTQPGFIIGYSTHLRIPLWTANRLNGSVSRDT